jgi:hypothetical protein
MHSASGYSPYPPTNLWCKELSFNEAIGKHKPEEGIIPGHPANQTLFTSSLITGATPTVEGVVQCQNHGCECRHRENPLKWTFASQVALGL